EEGRHGVLRRLAHPFWFQALGCVMGMDWHSSGITTRVPGALKRGLAGRERDLGITVCGGRGRHSRSTPAELTQFGERTGVDGAALARASRLVAKVDSALVQDGFDLYLHGFVVANDGAWTVVQQGMNTDRRQARRYHWLSEGVRSFVEEPHAAIEGRPGGSILNLTDRRAAGSRQAALELSREPERVLHELPRLQMPAHHEVRRSDVFLRRLHGTLAAARENGPRDFPELLLQPGVGPTRAPASRNRPSASNRRHPGRTSSSTSPPSRRIPTSTAAATFPVPPKSRRDVSSPSSHDRTPLPAGSLSEVVSRKRARSARFERTSGRRSRSHCL